MNEPDQIAQFESRAGRTKRHVLYVPPDTSVMEALAGEVCAALGKSRDHAYNDPEVIEGLGAFLIVIARLTAKSLTNGKASWIKRKR